MIGKLNLGNEFSDSEIFLVDGDSLLVSALNDDNLNWSFGGEMLHLIYLVERKLNKFVRKQGKFSVVFFQQSSILWQGNASYLLARSVLIMHLKCCTQYDVLDTFLNPWDPSFVKYLRIFNSIIYVAKL